MKKRFLALALGTLAFGVTLGGVKMSLGHQDALMVKAEEKVCKTLSFPDDNKANNKVGAYTKTWVAKNGTDSYSIANFNNNNWGWNFIKCGNKTAASVAWIKNDASFSEAITKVQITIDKIAASSVNSIKLYVSTDSDFKADSTTSVDFQKEKGTQSVSLTDPAADLFYKIEFDCKKGSDNGLVWLSKVEFFAESADVASVGSISLKADSAFKQEQFKGNPFDFSGLSVFANRTDNSSYSLKLDEVQWFVKGSAPESAEVALLDENGLIANSLTAGSYTLIAKYNEFASKENIALTIKDKVLATAVKIDVESPSIQVGETTTAIAVVSPDDTTLKDVTWHAEDDTIVSVDNDGNVKGLNKGTTKVFAVTKDGSNIESNRVEITVTGYDAKTYHQIITEQADYSGIYLLGYPAGKTSETVYTWNGLDAANGYNTATITGNILTGSKESDAHYIVLERLENSTTNAPRYSIKVANGSGKENFLDFSGDSNGIQTAETSETTYGVSWSAKGIDIVNEGGARLRFNSAKDQMRFRFFKSSTYSAQQPVQLYRLDYTADVAVSAKTFADKFVAAPICGTDDNTPANAGEFDKFVTEYSELSRDVRAYLANRDGESDASFKAFYDKYDAIMNKRASNTEFYDFLAGKYRPAKTQGVFGINQNITDSTTWTLVGIGAVTIAASASLLFFRRKKSN